MQERAREIEDGPARSDDHDHEDERRLGEVAALQIVEGMARAAVGHQEHEQHDGPEAEHHLDFAQQVPEPGMVGLGMGQRLEVMCAEGMQECDREDRDGGYLDHSRSSGGHAILAVAGQGWPAPAGRGNSGRLRMERCRSART